ncbi:MAG: hypothetical protein GY722_10060, partial [bacterium]|nr:hypothetical protein [bacterium]
MGDLVRLSAVEDPWIGLPLGDLPGDVNLSVKPTADYRALMRRVQEIVDRIERGDGESATVRHAADQVICRLRGE